MVSKYHLENSLIYLEGSDIPRNKLGITDSDELHEFERELLTEAYQIFYNELDDNTVFDEAYFKCELIALHPFYELNGRIIRLFFDMIVRYNNYRYIDYSNITPEYINASIKCVQFADCTAIEKIIANGLKN
jgi:cell filamentation protein